MREAYLVFDKDEHGKIPQSEMRFVLANLGEAITQQEIEDIIKISDPNGDGVIDFEEFTTIISS